MIDIEKLSADVNIPTEKLKQFAEAYAAKVLEDKEREIAELKTTVRSDNSKVIAALNAHINDLREALERIKASKTARYEVEADVGGEVFDVLEKTPAQSLQEHDNEVIEKCANVCDAWSLIGKSIAHDVRTLKG